MDNTKTGLFIGNGQCGLPVLRPQLDLVLSTASARISNSTLCGYRVIDESGQPILVTSFGAINPNSRDILHNMAQVLGPRYEGGITEVDAILYPCGAIEVRAHTPNPEVLPNRVFIISHKQRGPISEITAPHFAPSTVIDEAHAIGMGRGGEIFAMMGALTFAEHRQIEVVDGGVSYKTVMHHAGTNQDLPLVEAIQHTIGRSLALGPNTGNELLATKHTLAELGGVSSGR